MSVISEVINRVLRVRSMVASDLPRLLQIEKEPFSSRLIRHALPNNLPAGDRGIWVATIQNAVVGYVVYQLIHDQDPHGTESIRPPKGLKTADLPALTGFRIDLLHTFVAATWRRQGIGRALLERFQPFPLGKCDYYVQAAVSEKDLPVHLLLRSAGYKAVRVLRRHFGSEDAYLFQKVCKGTSQVPAGEKSATSV